MSESPQPLDYTSSQSRRQNPGWIAITVILFGIGLIAWAIATYLLQSPMPRPPAATRPVLPFPAATPIVLPQAPWQVTMKPGQSLSLPGGTGTPVLTLIRLQDRGAFITLTPISSGNLPVSPHSELSVPNGAQRLYIRLHYLRAGDATLTISLKSMYPPRPGLPAAVPASSASTQP